MRTASSFCFLAILFSTPAYSISQEVSKVENLLDVLEKGTCSIEVQFQSPDRQTRVYSSGFKGRSRDRRSFHVPVNWGEKKILADGKFDWENRWVVDEPGDGIDAGDDSKIDRDDKELVKIRNEKIAEFFERKAHETVKLTVPVILKNSKDGMVTLNFRFKQHFQKLGN